MSISGLGEVFDFGSKLLDKLVPDATQKANMQMALFKLQQTGDLAVLASETELAKGQIETNIEEAKSENIFKSGWRPATGWACVIGLTIQFIVAPLATFVASLCGVPIVFPSLDMGTLLTLLGGLLGLGTMRTYEKFKKVN